MNNFRYKWLTYSITFFDLFGLVVCFFLASAAIHKEFEVIPFSQFLSLRIKLINFILFTGFILLWYSVFLYFGLYHSRRLSSWRSDFIDIVNATLLGSLMLYLLSIVFNITLVNVLFIFLFWLYITIWTVSSRFLWRYILERLRRRGINLKNLLIVGTNPRAVRFAQSVDAKLELGYRIMGFVDRSWPGMGKFRASDYPLVADFAKFPEFLRNNVVDEVIIDLPLNTFYEEVTKIVRQCISQGIVVRFISDSFYLLRNMKLANAKVENFDNNLVISVATGAMGGWPIIAKRIFDFVVSLILIVCLSPLFLAVALLIKITSPGPVLFVQNRIGLNKRLFRMYKFRTMVVNAEELLPQLERYNEVSGPVFKIKNDPRITPIGWWLRKTSIDELPQLFNVLAGDMSLVGPRPLPVRDYQGFNHDWHRRRFSVRPGMTCLWQVSGRSSVSFDQWMELDMHYIDHWSFLLDLKVLVKTFPAIFQEKGAY